MFWFLLGMIFNYLRVAIRNMRRNKLYSVINIGGLALGLGVCMTILLYLVHEYSFDRFHPDYKRTFLAGGKIRMGDNLANFTGMSYVDGPMLKQADPRVESYMRINGWMKKVQLGTANNAVHFTEEKKFLFADSNFFSFFNFRLLRGDRSTVLSQPQSVVITESAAQKYFGTQDPVGQELLMDKKVTLQVSGVCADAPSNSSLQFSFVAPLALMRYTADSNQLGKDYFNIGTFLTFYKLKDPKDVVQAEATSKRLASAVKSNFEGLDFLLYPLADTHFNHSFSGEGGSTRYLNVFLLVAGLVLLLALINYMSLSTARAVNRAREVGVRKTIGARRADIARQFFTESALYALVSFLVGGILFLLLQKALFAKLRLTIDPSFVFTLKPMLVFGGLLVLTALLAGFYPSVVLSAFNPVAVLYGRLSKQRGGGLVRKGFTLFQFTISIGLIICTIFISRQLQHIRHTDTGLDRDNVVMINCDKAMSSYMAFKDAVKGLPAVSGAATADYQVYYSYSMQTVKLKSGQTVALNCYNVDSDFVALLGLKWKERPLSMARLTEGEQPVLNEAAVSALGLSGKIAGQSFGEDNVVAGGVVNNFAYSSLEAGVRPLGIYVHSDLSKSSKVMYVRLRQHSDVAAAMESIRRLYRSFSPESEFVYHFLDDNFNAQYKAEDLLAGLVGWFTGITILIACMGLFALATFSAEQRVKEIGIRKVLGDSVGGVARRLSIDFLKPVGLSLLIAIPASAWVMHQWLSGYASRTPLSWWIFPAAALLMGCVALGTVFFLSLKAARANPAKSLRSE